MFIERLWRSLKYECVYLRAFADFREARGENGAWVRYYNRERPHSTFGGRTPAEVHAGVQSLDLAAQDIDAGTAEYRTGCRTLGTVGGCSAPFAVDLWTSPSDRREPFGPCGQPLGNAPAWPTA